MWIHDGDATFPRKILLESLTETKASMVVAEMSGMALIILICGTPSPTLFAAMAFGGLITMIASSNLLSFTFFFMNSMNTFCLSDSSAPFHSVKHACFDDMG